MFKSSHLSKLKVSIILLFAFYIAGIIGILSNSQSIDFLSLTPLNLLVTAAILLINHQNGTPNQWFVFSSVAIVGFFIEVIGVTTGLIFGNYVYRTTLGWKFLETPLIIGVNWLLLTYSVVYTIANKISNKIIVAFAAASILVALDLLIEPVAMKYDFWMWENETVPIENYIAWFFISLGFCYVLAYFKGESSNNVAPYLLILQFIFFGIFNLTLWG